MDAQHTEQTTENVPAHEDVSLNEEETLPVTTDVSATAVAAPSSTTVASEQTWTEWIEEKKKEYGTPNDWIDANPTAKQYQHQANEFFKGIGQWGHEMALQYFPGLYNYGDTSNTRRQDSSSSSSSSTVQ